MESINLSSQSNFVRVNFTNRGLAKVFKTSESLSDRTPDKQNVLNIANLLSDVKISRGTPITFETIPEFLGIDYIGYIIEKERLDKQTGEWVRIDEYRIIGSASSNFIDTRVAYGESYRYRMKSIIKLSKAEKKAGLQHLEALQDIKNYEQIQIANEIKRNQVLLNNLDNVTALGLTSKTSAGTAAKEIPLDETTSLRATAGSTDVIRESWVPNRDLRLLDNLRVSDIDVLTGDISKKDFQTFINDNLQNFQEQQIVYTSCYFESNPTKNWLYVDVIETEPPPPPQTIRIVPDSVKKQIVISWLKPANSQRDIKYFRIYRRKEVGKRWNLLTESREIDLNDDGTVSEEEQAEADNAKISVNSNLFIDKNVNFDRPYQYALTCVDVHGIESFLSVQVQAELNKKYPLEKEEKPLKWISGSGAKPTESDYIVKRFLNRTERLIARRSISITPTTKFAETRKELIIKIKSLDTHEVQEIKVSLINTNVTETPL